MKLSITRTDFDYSCTLKRVEGGFSFNLVREVDGTRSEYGNTITEADIRARLSEKELSDATNLYFEFDTQTLRVARVFNKFMQSAQDKANGALFLWKNNINTLGQLYIPFADSPVEDWHLRINVGTGINEYPEDTEVVENSQEAFHEFVTKVLPSLEVKAINPRVVSDAQVEVQVTLAGAPIKKAGVRVFATAASGYINKREAYTDENGVARFVAERLHLEEADPMTVEFGFKFWSNLARADISHATLS